MVITANGGEFAYGMDGPYIHMAMADQIRQGHYGLNPGEPASPSSSILYPFLLALLTPLPFGAATSLIFCLAANAGSAVLLCLIASECGIRLRAVAPAYLAAMAAALSLGLNLVGLAMGGLEHAPQVTFSLAALLGLVRFCHRGRVEAWWIATLVLLPLLRFETGVGHPRLRAGDGGARPLAAGDDDPRPDRAGAGRLLRHHARARPARRCRNRCSIARWSPAPGRRPIGGACRAG